MSALSFKINAETDKLNSFIASLDRLKTVLGDIPSGTKEFDVINRKIAEMEARVGQSMKKIAQMQGEATRAVEQAASAGSSASGVQATKEDNVAYHELLETLKAVNASKEENIALISRYQAQIVKLKTDIKDLNEAERRGKQLTDAQKSSRFAAAVSVEEYKQAISRARKELANQIKLEQVARGSIDEMSQALSRMRAVYRSLNESERGSGWGQTLLKNIETLDAKIKGLDASMGVHARNVGNYASGFDMLGFQIQQVAREFPALAYGPQVFFAAISNNIPMLADEIARAKKQVKELKDAGKSFTPVWKQIASSLISWQTLLVAGVTVLTLYGKEIVGWVGSLFKGKQALDAAKVAADQFHATMTEGTVAAQAELTKLDLIYKAATDLSKPYEERAEAVKKLQDIYPAYFGNMAAEQVMVGNAVEAYEGLRDAIIEVARAKAAQDLITKDAQSILRIEQTGDAYNNYASALKKYNDEYKKRLEQTEDSGFELPGAIFEAEQYAKSVSGIKKYREEFISALEKMGDEGKEIWKQIKENYNGDVDAFIDAINKSIEKLAPSAEKLYTGKTPQELNAAANKARQEAENAAKKTKAQQERNQKELEKALEKLRDDALQAEIDSMQDGTAKKIAQINLDYQKRSRAIRKSVSELHKLWLEEYKNRNVQDKDSDQYKARQQMETQFKGNVDHLARPLIDAAELVKKGWEDAGEGIATVFSSQYGILDAKGKETEILVTPILPNGDILSPQELEDYIFNQLEGAQDILKADTKGIVIATNVSIDGSAGEKYHQLQGEYYADAIEFAESLRIRTQALNDANEAIRQSERHEAIAGKPAKIDLWKDFEEDEKAWNEYYEKYGTFRERLQATKDKYDRKLAEAQNEGERASIQAEYDAALAQLEIESSSWAKELINKTISELENIQTQLENELEAAKRTFNAFESSSDPEAQQWAARINKLEAQLKALTPQINKAKKAASDNDWAKGALALNAIADGAREALNGVRDLDEGLADALETLVNIASSAGSFASAMEGVLNGASFTNIASAVASGISLISSVIGALGLFGPSAETKQYEALVKQYSGLIDIWDQLIEKKRDYINESWGEELTNTREETLELLKMQTETSRMLAKSRLRAGASAGSHSYGYRMWKGSYKFEGQNWRDVADEISAALGTPITWIDTFADLSSEQLQWIKENYSGLWSQMDGEFRDYLENIITYGEQANEVIEQAKEQITQISFDSFESDFASLLADMNSDSKDFADNFEKYLQNAIMSSLVGNKYKEKLRDLYDEWAAMAESGNELTPEEIEKLRNKYKNITEAALSERDVWKDILGWEETTSGQTATSRGFQAMSQDTGDELNGRFTDIQGKVTDIRGFMMSDTMQIIGILSTCQHIELIQIEGLQVNQELLRHAVMTYLEIVEINSTTKAMNKTLLSIDNRLNKIERNTSAL